MDSQETTTHRIIFINNDVTSRLTPTEFEQLQNIIDKLLEQGVELDIGYSTIELSGSFDPVPAKNL